jgi:hypothetical protein
MSAEPSRLAVVAALSIALATPPSLTRASTSMISWPPPPSLRTQRDATEKAARSFYGFWNTGDERTLAELRK